MLSLAFNQDSFTNVSVFHTAKFLFDPDGHQGVVSIGKVSTQNTHFSPRGLSCKGRFVLFSLGEVNEPRKWSLGSQCSLSSLRTWEPSCWSWGKGPGLGFRRPGFPLMSWVALGKSFPSEPSLLSHRALN